MGTALVKQPANNTVFLDCTVDADCYKANSNLTVNQPAATTDTEKAKRCCMKFLCWKAENTTDAVVSLDAAKLLGWATNTNTYTKICNYDYPQFFKTDFSGPAGASISEDASGNEWKIYCDGGASTLVASAIAASAIAAVSMY